MLKTAPKMVHEKNSSKELINISLHSPKIIKFKYWVIDFTFFAQNMQSGLKKRELDGFAKLI